MSPHNHPLKTMLALTLALGAIAPTAASARFDLNPPTATTTTSLQPAVPIVRANPDQQGVESAPAVHVVRIPAPGGFDWGDAGIGAVGGFGLSMLGLGGGLVIAQRRGRRSSGPAAATS